MTIIKFHHRLKSEIFGGVDSAEKRWQSSLPKVPGQIGQTMVTSVEHPAVGDMLVYTVDQRFVDFLRDEGVSFAIV
ncbi:hypothetical protein [Burkholderia vietnamiensis]|uniref:hypothetical protein n=1 Tax=Burkholderia vietnamiensis TaxID=60552 RepID=UPI001B8E32CA|nr:hypothetical protein [Burkholderia vietnamiensis]MBR8005557.1 hypothetical protein [Burkholderia vietnamiensis]